MNAPGGWTRLTPGLAGRLGGFPAGVASLLAASSTAGAGEAAGEVADVRLASAYTGSLGGDAVSLVGLALVGVIAISRRHNTR